MDYKWSRRALLAFGLESLLVRRQALAAFVPNFSGVDVFNSLLKRAQAERWRTLPIGEVVGKVAVALEGTPYKAGTLELPGNTEACSIDMSAFDCVTFFESALDFARMLKSGGSSPEDMLREVASTRYRDRVVGDYTSRLHYTTDWLLDNQRKHVVTLLEHLPGTQHYKKRLDFMTTHTQLYAPLQSNPALVAKMKTIENTLSAESLPFVPLDKLQQAEAHLQTGDIVAIRTNVPGLDFSHTGLVVRTADGVAHFMDASSKKSAMRVTLEPGHLSETLAKFTDSPGITFARPLEP